MKLALAVGTKMVREQHIIYPSVFLAFWDNSQVKRRDFAVHARQQIVSVNLCISFFTASET